MDAVLNENTNTIHKRGDAPLQTVCGHTSHVSRDRLRETSVEHATAAAAEKCGGCFEEAGGY